ncbi:CoA-binding protein [Psychroserpens ponticola]|uniref:CoA-binding protein n=1 Tax=Psychroserpens ponticola TaxID=2932268 RepID=A0ABY7RV25_9FLAO|nr:CoA-binding protein [Psychroserpens ponticola]WCO00954.1 CoA-binding protein [Psychroserpens ponticola]
MKKTLVIGASLKLERYSNIAINRLVSNNYEVVAFGLREGTVSGVEIDINLMPYKDVHTVTLYLNPERQKAFYDYIMSLQPKRVIFNPGTENLEFQNVLKQNNIFFEEACTLVLLGTNQY